MTRIKKFHNTKHKDKLLNIKEVPDYQLTSQCLKKVRHNGNQKPVKGSLHIPYGNLLP